MVRLDIAPNQPLAVQQWQGLIAINYPARAYGLNRHVTIFEAKKLCPDIICQHVATWKEGEERWAYHDDAFAHMDTHKVSLDPYRLESRKILATIKDVLPADCQKVEKASIDEVFVDLSAQTHRVLLQRYPMLSGPAPYDDPTEQLPRPPTTVLDWDTDALIDLDTSETEDDDPDWDDIVMMVASEIVRDLRRKIYERLKYTCSAGVARNKMLAKLGSGHKKPNSQTIVRNRAVQKFLSGFKFTKIRNLGGKLGDEVVAAFNTDTVNELLEVPLEQLKKQMGDDTGSWLYSIIRGEDHSEVNTRTQIKSMLSAKSFRPSINTFETGIRWLRIFVADIFSRLVEEGVLENKRRPRTINLHHRQGAQTRSKQSPIPQGKTIDETMLFESAKNLLAQVAAEGRAWPCANLSLSVGGFEDGVTGNKGIGGFLVRGEEARAVNAMTKPGSDREQSDRPPPGKRRRVDEGGIRNFFGSHQESEGGSEKEDTDAAFGNEELEQWTPPVDAFAAPPSGQGQPADGGESETSRQTHGPSTSNIEHMLPAKTEGSPPTDQYTCARCSKRMPDDRRAEHEDWHFAKDLQTQMSSPAPAPPRPPSSSEVNDRVTVQSQQHKGKGRGRPAGGGLPKTEKGQRKLAFG